MKSRILPWYSFLLCLAISGLSCGGGEQGLVCGKQLDCTQEGKPICSLAFCLGCNQDTDCKTNWMQRKQESEALMMSLAQPLTVACEASIGACRECLNDAHCSEARPSEPLLRVCDPNFKTCVGCLQNSDCAANAVTSADGLLTCDTSQKKCIDCMTPNDCIGRSGMPFCVANRCSACEKDINCAAVPGKPYCDTTSSSARLQCLSCTGQPATFCGKHNAAKPFCDGTGTCVPCSKHEECGNGPGTSTGSGVCYRPGDYVPPAAVGTLTPGQCVPESFVKDVTKDTIGAELGAGKPYLRLADGNYGDLSIGREVVLVAARSLDPKSPTAAKPIISSVTVTAGRVTLYDVRIERTAAMPAKSTIKCTGGQLQLRFDRVSNRSIEYGIDASNIAGACAEVNITQTVIESDWQALLLTAPAVKYLITNTMIARSGSPGGPPFHTNAVELGATASGTFAFNTLYLNQAGIVCNSTQKIVNSAITGVGTSTIGCDPTTDTSNYKNTSAGAAGDYAENPAGSGAYHPSTAMQTNLKGKATGVLNPAITTDLFGGSRPLPVATTADIGCEELP